MSILHVGYTFSINDEVKQVLGIECDILSNPYVAVLYFRDKSQDEMLLWYNNRKDKQKICYITGIYRKIVVSKRKTRHAFVILMTVDGKPEWTILVNELDIAPYSLKNLVLKKALGPMEKIPRIALECQAYITYEN